MRSGPNRSEGASNSGGSHNRPLARRLLQFPADWPAEFRHRSAVPPPAFLVNLRPQQPPPDHRRQLLAPEGWLELGNWNEANEELEKFTLGTGASPMLSESGFGFMQRQVVGSCRRFFPSSPWSDRRRSRSTVGGWKESGKFSEITTRLKTIQTTISPIP